MAHMRIARADKSATVTKNTDAAAPKSKDSAVGISWYTIKSGEFDASNFGVSMDWRDQRKRFSVFADGFTHRYYKSDTHNILGASFAYSAIYSGQDHVSLHFGVSAMTDINIRPSAGAGIEMGARLPLLDHVALTASVSENVLTNGDTFPIAKLGLEMFVAK